MVQLDASGNHLLTKKSDSSSIRVSWVRLVRTAVKRLELKDDLKSAIRKDPAAFSAATHFVVQIYEGGTASLTLEGREEGSTDEKATSGGAGISAKAALSWLSSASASASGSSKEMLENVSKQFSFTCTSDFTPDGGGQQCATADLTDVRDLMENLPTKLPPGKPVKYIMLSVNDPVFISLVGFDYELEARYVRLNEAIVDQFVWLFDSITHVSDSVAELMADVRKVCRDPSNLHSYLCKLHTRRRRGDKRHRRTNPCLLKNGGRKNPLRPPGGYWDYLYLFYKLGFRFSAS